MKNDVMRSPKEPCRAATHKRTGQRVPLSTPCRPPTQMVALLPQPTFQAKNMQLAGGCVLGMLGSAWPNTAWASCSSSACTPRSAVCCLESRPSARSPQAATLGSPPRTCQVLLGHGRSRSLLQGAEAAAAQAIAGQPCALEDAEAAAGYGVRVLTLMAGCLRTPQFHRRGTSAGDSVSPVSPVDTSRWLSPSIAVLMTTRTIPASVAPIC